MPVPVVTGSRFALEPGRGAASVPVRPALFGAIFGVLGIVAVFTFANGIHDTVNSPARFGQTWDLSAFAGLNGEDFIPAAETGAAIANDPDVRAINDVRLNVAQINGDAVSMLTLDPVDQPLDIVLTEGAIASRKGEITIGPRTADATGLGTGDTVEVTGSHGTQTLTVTGIGFLFPSPHNDYASGGWVTPETYDSLFDGFKFHFFIVDVADGASPSDVSERLGAMGIGLDPNEQFGEQRQLLQIQSIPWFLAGFLALLGIGAVGHALVTAVRRRRHELAVLRALGMTPPQSGAVVAAQATTLTLAGLVIGVPLGVALGRTLWHYVADLTPVYYVPPVAVLALVLIAPISLLASNVLAVRPSFRAANMQLGEELRTE
jgi:ABC-type lipoprotein release transport system permease subunit